MMGMYGNANVAEFSKLIIYVILLSQIACSHMMKDKPHGFFPIKEYGKWGYINSNGETVIKCQFDGATGFSDGLASICIDTLFGFIDTTGKIVIAPGFYLVSGFSDGLSRVVYKKGKNYEYAFINKCGSIAFKTPYSDVGFFNNGRAEVKINDEVCYINKRGKIVFNTPYPYSTGGFCEGVTHVWNHDSSKCFDTTGNELKYLRDLDENFTNGIALARKYDTVYYYLDKSGKPKVKPKNQNLSYRSFSDGMAQVVIAGNDHKSGFIDTTGNIVIPITYSDINDFKEGLAAFNDSGRWGFINKKGIVVIKPQFDQVEYTGFYNGLCKAKKNHQWAYINLKGEFVWKAQVGFEYKKIDLKKWSLDTLKINRPLSADKYAGADNYPRTITFQKADTLVLKVDTTDLTVFADRYLAYKLYLINGCKQPMKIQLQDGRIKIIQQALNKKGVWQDIENFYNSWCGNSYYNVRLPANTYQIFATPIFKGEFKTLLRFKFEQGNVEIYSNSHQGRINPKQFLDPKDKDRTGIAVYAY